MKSLATPILLITLFAIVHNALAQRSVSDRVSYTYFRPPLEKLDESIKQYHVAVDVPFANAYRSMMEQYGAERQAADEEYAAALESYQKQDMGDKVLGSILLDDSGKPKKRIVAMPAVRTDIPTDSEIESKLNLDGFTKSTDQGLKVTVEVYDYEVSATEKSSGEGEKQRWFMEVKIKQPMRLSVKTPGGDIRMDETPAGTETFYSFKTNGMKKPEFNAYVNGTGYDTWLSSQKRTVRDNSLGEANNALNERFGYSWANRFSPIYSAKGKEDYSNLDAAQTLCKQALTELSVDEDKAKQKLGDALQTWETELKGIDMDNRKARINNKVGAGLYFNLALAYILLLDFDKADHALNVVESDDGFKGGDQREAENLRGFLNDQKLRHMQ